MNISEFSNEIEYFDKNLQEKELIIDSMNQELEELNNCKMQKFGSIIKSQSNLPEIYGEMYYFKIKKI